MNTLSVALFGHRAGAEPLRDRLARAGIPAEIHEEAGLRKLWFVSRREAGVRIKVPVHDFEPAKRLLLRWDMEEGALRGAIRCPECKSLQVSYPQFARHSLLTNVSLGLAAKCGLVEPEYYCEECHYTWPKTGTRPRRNRAHMAPYYFIDGVEQTTLVEQTERPEAERAAA
jgi:hypothetical protein